MDQPTTFTDIETSFHSMPLTKYRIDPGLEKQWLETAIADYKLCLLLRFLHVRLYKV